MKMLLMIVLLATVYSWGQEDLPISQKQVQRLGIEFANPEPLEEQYSAPWPGVASVMPAHEYRMTLPLDVIVKKLYVLEGQQVEKGQLIVRMASRDLRLWANHLLSAYDELRQCNEVAEKIKRRLELGLSTASELSRQQKDCAQAGNTLDSAKGSLQHAGWDREKIEAFIETRKLDDTLEMTAPLSGIIYRLPIMPGNHLEAGAELVTIWPLDQVRLQLKLPFSWARQLKVGQPCTLADGRVAQTEVISQLVAVDNRVAVWLFCEGLTPGERVSVRLPLAKGTSWLLPTKAVVRHDQKDWVFLKTKTGVMPIEVFRGTAKKRMIQVSGNIHIGDEIAIMGTAALKGLWLGLGGE